MLLYVCRTCGKWQDVSAATFLTDMWNRAMVQFPTARIETQGYPCPDGHGLMTQVQSTDRLYVQPLVVDALNTEEVRPEIVERAERMMDEYKGDIDYLKDR